MDQKTGGSRKYPLLKGVSSLLGEHKNVWMGICLIWDWKWILSIDPHHLVDLPVGGI